MNIKNIFIHPKFKVYYYLKDDSICSECFSEFQSSNMVVICCKYYKDRKGIVKGYCKSCASKVRHDADVENWITAYIVDDIPNGCTYYIENPPILKPSKLSDQDPMSLDSEITINNTKYANKESIEGATIGDTSQIEKNDLDFEILEHFNAKKLKKHISQQRRLR